MRRWKLHYVHGSRPPMSGGAPVLVGPGNTRYGGAYVNPCDTRHADETTSSQPSDHLRLETLASVESLKSQVCLVKAVGYLIRCSADFRDVDVKENASMQSPDSICNRWPSKLNLFCPHRRELCLTLQVNGSTFHGRKIYFVGAGQRQTF